MLKKEQLDLINKCFFIFKSIIENNIKIKNIFLKDLEGFYCNKEELKLEEVKKIEDKLKNSNYSLTPREKIILVNISGTIRRHLESMMFIFPTISNEDLNQEGIIYNEKILSFIKEIDKVFKELKNI